MKRRKNFGFTLVELLVIIAIIAVLIAMFLPALNKAKDMAYISMCLNNQHQMAVGLTGYVGDWKGQIPPNANRTDGVDPTYGPYQFIGTDPSLGRYLFTTRPSNQNSFRVDNSAITDWAWTNGMGRVWADGYIPYTAAGARVFWCPAQQNGKIDGNNGSGYITGPLRYWAQLWNKPNSCGSPFNGGANAAVGSMANCYAYRALGRHDGPTKGSWDIHRNSPYVAVVDVCTNIYGNTAAFSTGTFTNYSHGSTSGRYIGFNRMWYDGHANWFNDPTVVWEQDCPPYGGLLHDTGYGNVGYGSSISPADKQWRRYDN